MNNSTKSRIRNLIIKGDSVAAEDFQVFPKLSQTYWVFPVFGILAIANQSFLYLIAWFFLYFFKVITLGIINRDISAALKVRDQEQKLSDINKQKEQEILDKENKAIRDKKKAKKIAEQNNIKTIILHLMDTAFESAVAQCHQQFDIKINLPISSWEPNHYKQMAIYNNSVFIEDYSSLKKNCFSRGINITESIIKFNKYIYHDINVPKLKNNIMPFYFSGDSEKRATEPVKRYRTYVSHTQSIFSNIFEILMEKESLSISMLGDTDWNLAIDNLKAKCVVSEASYQECLNNFQADSLDKIIKFNKASRNGWEDNNIAFINDSAEPKDLSSDNIQFFCKRLFQYLLNVPVWMPVNISIFWEKESQVLILDAEMPDLSGDISKLRELKSGKKIVSATKKEAEQFREDILFYYPILLTYLVAKNNVSNWLKFICINGFVKYIDPATGNPTSANILSMAVKPEDIVEIDIKNIEPTACFKRFKGLSASKVADLIPVEPIISFNKDENRFIDGKDVTDSVSGTNLALMDWQDFEYLVRQIFEEEFQSAGAEVRVTQSSRDKGVDAIIFDPDPIRGGKIVVQAKRYSHTVDVSAVRDLYGTVLNEGANSGIIITTSNYGKDSHDFAKDKPLKLLNGSNLLHLLEKHGHKAHIDLDEAKKKLAADRRNSKE